ncbi:Laminin subunit gamma-1 [Lasiodiplodia theobromae]|uniref:Laminin subunit gamma-1 n=1 Tax=Lasiodiplodia theobromae TaxID=45133 RepID=UPI0015C3975C|nr:Laminin subunit gamma-1 [Lasiodiplodia theobromae]KAF4546784.1 Laminin subunit gamma-1 [Lasiodiplodia theobromae]
MTPKRTPSYTMPVEIKEEVDQAGSDQDGRASPAAAEAEVTTNQMEGEDTQMKGEDTVSSADTKRNRLNQIMSLNKEVNEHFESYKNVVQMLNHFTAEYETNLAEITSIQEQEDNMYQIPAFLQNLTEVVTSSGLYTGEEALGMEADVATPWSEEMARLANLKDKLVKDNEDLGRLMETLRIQVRDASKKLALKQDELKALHARNALGGT